MESINWSLVPASPIYKAILREWKNLLSDKSAKEERYQAYLAQYSGFLFPKQYEWNEQLVMAKIRLGSDYVTDFVIASGRRSYGFEYTLVEIESPHCQPYTIAGHPSERLNTAIQQVQDWQRWIERNREEAKRIFPSKNFIINDDPNFKYVIVIGRRSGDGRDEARRNHYARSLGVEIRSFDYLTDAMEIRRFSPFTWMSRDIFPVISEKSNNDFSNPFARSYTNSEWKKIVSSGIDISHMVAQNLEILLSCRRYNMEDLREFKMYLDGLTDLEIAIPKNDYKLLEYH